MLFRKRLLRLSGLVLLVGLQACGGGQYKLNPAYHCAMEGLIFPKDQWFPARDYGNGRIVCDIDDARIRVEQPATAQEGTK